MKCTRILNFMVLSGFMVNYMLRVNMNIAIVDMVYNNKHHNVPTDQVNNMSNSTSIGTIVSKCNTTVQ